MTGRRELWEVTRFSGQRRGFEPQCDCYRTNDRPALHLLFELPGVDPAAVRLVAVGTALVVSGVRERPHPNATRYHQVEIEYGPDPRARGVRRRVQLERRDRERSRARGGCEDRTSSPTTGKDRLNGQHEGQGR